MPVQAAAIAGEGNMTYKLVVRMSLNKAIVQAGLAKNSEA